MTSGPTTAANREQDQVSRSKRPAIPFRGERFESGGRIKGDAHHAPNITDKIDQFLSHNRGTIPIVCRYLEP
jgi:hypothetical protein